LRIAIIYLVIAYFTRTAALAAERSANLASEAASESCKQARRMSEITLNAAKARVTPEGWQALRVADFEAPVCAPPQLAVYSL
jgi:hypothetical protein